MQMKEITPIYKVLSDAHRFDLLKMLCSCGCEMSVGDLNECCSIDMSVVSRHLSQLNKAGLVKSERRGRSVFYSANTSEVANILRDLADTFEDCCNSCCSASPTEPKPKEKPWAIVNAQKKNALAVVAVIVAAMTLRVYFANWLIFLNNLRID